MSGHEPVPDIVARALCERITAGDDVVTLARRYGITPSVLLWIVREYIARVGAP